MVMLGIQNCQRDGSVEDEDVGDDGIGEQRLCGSKI